MVSTPKEYINDYKVQLAKDNKKLIEGFVKVEGINSTQDVVVEIPELKIKSTFQTDNQGLVKFNIPVKKLTYWSPDSPKLYDVKITSKLDEVHDKIGFRTIKTVDKNILLNGKSIFLKGISVHDENPLLGGRLRSDADMRMLLTWAK